MPSGRLLAGPPFAVSLSRSAPHRSSLGSCRARSTVPMAFRIAVTSNRKKNGPKIRELECC